jgi:hypothetical protein
MASLFSPSSRTHRRVEVAVLDIMRDGDEEGKGWEGGRVLRGREKKVVL